MKKIWYSLFLLLSLSVSCSDDIKLTGTESTIKIRANVLGISDIGSVKTWVMNTLTFERQWVTLTQSNSFPNIWEGDVTLKNGDYSMETLVRSKLEEPVVYVEQLQFKIKKSITASFKNLNENPPFKLSDFEHHTILTSSDPCDFKYKIYIGNNLCDSYVYLDRFFWDGITGEILAYSSKEILIGSNSCVGYPDHVNDTGVLTGTMIPSEARDCALTVEGAEIIDGMIMSAGKLENGQEFETAFDFIYHKNPNDNGRVVNNSGIIVRKKFLPESVLKQIK